ncbi:MAG: Lrp/AsnC ligand binding domain-containing protein [Steroidobacteraceae bacterium]|jgi:DNA-binding Lrp family transcriptional regulator|nr:Lrp/AsnC ligand binding domain-containing protein [Steroidobacteraceae bacterium]
MHVTAIVLIKAQTDTVSALAEALVDIPGVAEVFSVAGHYDLVAIVRVADNDRLASVVSDGIRKLPGIAGTETLIAFRAYSRGELEAAYSIGLS